MATEEDRERLRKQFAVPEEQLGNRWDDLWEKADFLPWDKGFPNPALADTLSERTDLFDGPVPQGTNAQRKRALVPGCGKGYDVLLLAGLGYDAYGLEISQNAVKACEKLAETEASKYMVHPNPGNYKFVVGDFYKDDWMNRLGIPETGGFDLIYDYTFLCAMRPSLRPAWAKRMTELLARNGGKLFCLEFPTYKEPSTGGPPFGLKPETYLGHLSHPGKEIPYGDDGYPKEETYAEGSAEGRALERIDHWQPKRSHDIGKGTDWISVWRHRS